MAVKRPFRKVLIIELTFGLILSAALFVSLSENRGMPKFNVLISAYSSTKDQTDNTPFITATGDDVFDGLVAANFLDIGAQIQIPSIFGKKIFTVKDRMNRRFTNSYPHRIDIWFPDKAAAKGFGIKEADIIVVKNPEK